MQSPTCHQLTYAIAAVGATLRLVPSPRRAAARRAGGRRTECGASTREEPLPCHGDRGPVRSSPGPRDGCLSSPRGAARAPGPGGVRPSDGSSADAPAVASRTPRCCRRGVGAPNAAAAEATAGYEERASGCGRRGGALPGRRLRPARLGCGVWWVAACRPTHSPTQQPVVVAGGGGGAWPHAARSGSSAHGTRGHGHTGPTRSTPQTACTGASRGPRTRPRVDPSRGHPPRRQNPARQVRLARGFVLILPQKQTLPCPSLYIVVLAQGPRTARAHGACPSLPWLYNGSAG